jgi:preprotein translocase subunit SecG
MWIFGIIVFFWVIICVLLVLVVLIQSDKGGGISSAFGGGLSSAQALLGTQDTKNLLTRATTILATLFMAICILLSLILGNYAARGEVKSVLKQRAEKQGENYSPASALQGGGLPIQSEQAAGAAQQATPATPQNLQNVPLPIQAAPAAPATAQKAPEPKKK